MKVYFVGSGPGDPGLLTVRASQLISSAKVCIFAGSLVGDEILKLIPATSERHDSAEMTLEQIAAVCKDAAARGVDVIRLHSGEPSIYGAIGEQIIACDELGIEYEVVPGISSFQAAAAALKKELTCPEVSQTVILTRLAGRTPVPDEQALKNLAATKSTLCVFLSTGAIDEVCATVAGACGEDCPMALVYHASRQDQKVITGTAGDLAGKVKHAGIDQTAMIIAGRALAGGSAKSKLYDKDFTHGRRKA